MSQAAQLPQHPVGGGTALFRLGSNRCELSAKLAAFLGWSGAQTLSLADWLAPEDCNQLTTALSAAASGPAGAASCSFEVTDALGQTWCIDWGLVSGDEEGTVLGTGLIYASSRHVIPPGLLRDVIEALPVGLALYDRDDRLIVGSAVFRAPFEDKTDISPVGRTFAEIARICRDVGAYDRASPDPDTYLHFRIKAHQDCSGVLLQKLRTGRIERIEEICLPSGHRLGIHSDVTQFIAETRSSKDRETAKTDFLSVMSHEIRTPLVGLIGMLDFLVAAETKEDCRRIEGIMRKAAGQLLQILDCVMDVSKIESGQMVLEKVPFSPESALSPLIDRYSLLAKSKGLDFVVSMDTPMEDRIGDPLRLCQIVDNLLSNAVKFTDEGQISLRLSQRDPGQLQIDVADTGIGFAADILPRLLLPFEQADPSRKRKYGGSGLGMAIVSRLTQLFGGTVKCLSTEGQGTTFTILLPLQAVAAKPKAEPPSLAKMAADFTGLRAMITDDNEINRDVLRTYLEHLGFHVDLACDGMGALRLAKSADYDVILLDISMPDIDGTEVLRRIRTLPRQDGVPAIAVTANVLKSDIDSFLGAGFDRVVSKPFSKADLIAALTEAGVGANMSANLADGRFVRH